MTDLRSAVAEATDDAPRSFKWAMYLMGAVAFVSLVGPHLFFWLGRTAVLKDGKPVGDELWSQYGDFIGGIANPVISLLTFAGLLYTILVQRQELALQRRELKNSSEALQATKEELRQTKKIAAGQAEFNRNESRKSDIEKALVLISSELDLALAYRRDKISLSAKELLYSLPEICVKQFKKIEANPLTSDTGTDEAISLLIRLSLYMSYYEKYDQDSAFLLYYNMKYGKIAGCVLNTGLLDRKNFNSLLNARSP